MTDHDIAAANARQNDYWQRVGGHPDAGYEDKPRAYHCEGHNCHASGMDALEEAPYGTMRTCADCELSFCPDHWPKRGDDNRQCEECLASEWRNDPDAHHPDEEQV
jgi:hypothetical protein